MHQCWLGIKELIIIYQQPRNTPNNPELYQTTPTTPITRTTPNYCKLPNNPELFDNPNYPDKPRSTYQHLHVNYLNSLAGQRAAGP